VSFQDINCLEFCSVVYQDFATSWGDMILLGRRV
jgi:hypothetical protein